MLVHAGKDKSGGGGAEGTYAIWAHSSAIAKGYKVPGKDVSVSNYIVQPEDSGVGVFAHEYGHDLGLPDLYDTASGGESDVNFWDLMSSGSHSGPIFQSMPTHMGIWDKWVLGWADPKVFNQGDDTETIKLGQTSRTPLGSKDGAIVHLPDKTVQIGEPHGGSGHMWWSDNDQDWADNNITRDVSVPTPAGADKVKFWMWNDYVMEEDWDFGFVEVSDDGGQTWNEQVVRTEVGRRGGQHPGQLPGPVRSDGRLRRQEVRPHRELRRLAARLRRPDRVRRQDHPAAPALRHRRCLPGARLVRRRLLPHQRRGHHVDRRRRGRRPTAGRRTRAPSCSPRRRPAAGRSSTEASSAPSSTWPSGATSTGSTRG